MSKLDPVGSVPTTPATSTEASTTPLSTTDGEVSNSTPQEDYDGGENEGHRQEEENASAESQQEETGDWHQVGRQGARFKCQMCGYTRNTKHQLEKQMHERHEENYDGPHESNRDSQIYCDMCNKPFRTKRELSYHMSTDHHVILMPGQEFFINVEMMILNQKETC